MRNSNKPAVATDLDGDGDGIGLIALLSLIVARWRLIFGGSMLAGVCAFGGAWLLPPIYTARTVVMPPQQQSSAAAALSSLGALAGLAGGVGVKSTADQYVALMQSSTVSDRIIDRFKLMEVYEETYRIDARVALLRSAMITVGKKDGLLVIEVEDKNPQRAADIANAYVEELRYMTNTLAVSEAQQRRRFFEQKLEETKSRLTNAQVALQASGFNAGALRAEPRAAAEGYARMRAEATAADVKLQTLRRMLADGAPEVIQQQTLVAALKSELNKLEQKDSVSSDAGYVGRYREYKYQETLFDLYAKQFELARLDESREGALIQVVDLATAPEKKSKPKRAMMALGSAFLVGIVLVAWVLLRGSLGQGGRQSLAPG